MISEIEELNKTHHFITVTFLAASDPGFGHFLKPREIFLFEGLTHY